MDEIEDFDKIVSTSSSQAQKWVNLGLKQLFGFNHYAAIKCFQQAIQEDQNCCFAFWAISYSLGPHYNSPEISLEDYCLGLDYLQKAQETKQFGQNWQQDLIHVLRLRYPSDFQQKPQQAMFCGLKQFSIQMEKVFLKYPNDIQITSIYAESIMNLRPWALWLKDGTPTEQAISARTILQAAIGKGYHPHIYHLYLHLMELSPEFYKSLPLANELYQKEKNVSHLIHMPSHIFIQVGDYIRSIQSNIKALQADRIAKLLYNKQVSFFQFYRAHNVHFLIWAAMFLGDYETAKKYSSFMWEVVNEEVMKIFSKYMEFYLNTELHVMIRFGKWSQILEKQIQQRKDYPIYKASQRYSRAIAYAVLGKIDQAQQEFKLFQILRNQVGDRKYGNNTPEDVFNIAQSMAKGQILYRKGQYELAFMELRKSVQLSDNLVYDEPWNWMQPPRHALGALLLEQNRFQQAEQVYLKDLKSYPNNIWSLTGLNQLYEKTGNEEKRKQISENLKIAQQNSKNNIEVSCFCKKSKNK